LHLDFWGSNNEAVGKADSNMYEFMIEFLRIKLILCLECQPIGRSTYCRCSCIHLEL
jgi:hypothetical protein